MRDNEIVADADLVRRLLAAQFPHLASLALTRVQSTGTENVIYRLGTDLSVRLPRIEDAIRQIEFEAQWLPRLAPCVTFAIPEPVGLGAPGEGYPWPWAIHRWIDGVHPTEELAGSTEFATDLARFVVDLRSVDASGARGGYRSVPLRSRERGFLEWTSAAKDLIDTAAMLEVWDEALAAPEWDGPSRWTHGDLLPGNVLVRGGRLHAVLDFGTAGVGDPACDAFAGWAMLDPPARRVFRQEAGFDDAAWARGRGWTLTFVGALTYYRDTNPVLAEVARRSILRVLADG
ncbi:aminoglycoside phosphotransferase family protein [Rugosimonospora africana]|uniref:Phosphotransferase n=1 Tax=Rugosimonospora africana TaxID=556532 RepID=A0A8J3QNF0_9ACTN|nr:aminoglycoside phosphotransferase family protein [Rugosimonospora africana]GIH14295.1 phosphotransferase [Rugosimonospora africana]